MIKIIGNDITRNGEKIGWIEENDIYNEDGKKLGYYSDESVFNSEGHKVGYIKGNDIKTMDGYSFDLDDNKEEITGGSFSDIVRAAVKLLIGD
ncbi:MAG: 4-fold beta flower protein [Patescibacteria group bacterium]|mgnify:CR=1 FL=1